MLGTIAPLTPDACAMITNDIDELNPPPRLLMGPGPVNADPRVLRAMSMPILGQFDPAFTTMMNEVMVLYRRVLRTENLWTFLIDGTARAGIEAVLTSVIEPGDKVLVPIFGRFGYLAAEIAERVGADVHVIERKWGTVFPPEEIEDALRRVQPKLVALVQGDTSTTMAQPLADIGPLCRRHGALLYVDATATVGGMDLRTDEWQIDAVSIGLQKCLSGPPGVAPITFNERIEKCVVRRKHVEKGIEPPGFIPGAGLRIRSNYFDLGMLMDYWSADRLNHHTEATSMLYAARECARLLLKEGLDPSFSRHERASRSMAAGLTALGLELFGDQTNKMPNVTGILIPEGVDGEKLRAAMLNDFGIEIGSSFGPLKGRIWRIGAMGYACRKENVLICLAALETVLRHQGFAAPPGAGVDAAITVYREAPQKN